MAEEGVYKAEVVYVQDPEEGQLEKILKNTTQSEVSILVHSVPGQTQTPDETFSSLLNLL